MWQRTASWLLMVGTAMPILAEDGSVLPASLRAFRTLSDDSRLRFQIVSGRLAVQTVHFGAKSRQVVERKQGESFDRVTFVAGDPNVLLHATRSTPAGTLTVDAEQPCGLRIDCQFKRQDGSCSITYTQCWQQGVRLVVQGPGMSHRLRAASVWNLCFEHPHVARQYLFPLLAACAPDWRLEPQCELIRSALLATAHQVSFPSQKRMALLVRRLGSSKRRVRQEAFRELREMGHPVLPYLDELERAPLDREQRMQLTRLRRSLQHIDYDTPRRVAARLATEPRVWSALARSGDLELKAVAARQLQRLSGNAPVADYAANR